MSDIKLFRLQDGRASELLPQAAPLERHLQQAFERNLETILGIRFVKSDHSTGAVHLGRIDPLGIDEDGAPVIIEYKRSTNENVINQGLFYLDWLMDHRAEFELLVTREFGDTVAKTIDWSATRLICLAGDFTRYDEHAVKQIGKNIELLRYRRFGADYLIVELVHAPKVSKRQTTMIDAPPAGGAKEEDPYLSMTLEYRLRHSVAPLRELFESTTKALAALGDDIQQKPVKYYLAFRRIKNFACLQIGAKSLTLWLKVNPETIVLEDGFTRDVRGIGHYGTGDLEVTTRSNEDLVRAQPLFERAYSGGLSSIEAA